MFFQTISLYLFWPVALLLGVSSKDCGTVGELIGTKVFLNEFLAYKELGLHICFNKIWSLIHYANYLLLYSGFNILVFYSITYILYITIYSIYMVLYSGSIMNATNFSQLTNSTSSSQRTLEVNRTIFHINLPYTSIWILSAYLPVH